MSQENELNTSNRPQPLSADDADKMSGGILAGGPGANDPPHISMPDLRLTGVKSSRDAKITLPDSV